MNKQFFEKRCKFSIRKFTLGVASVMIGATFFAASPVLADQARVGSTDNLPSELADLDKKASDEGHDFDKEAAAQNPGSAETTDCLLYTSREIGTFLQILIEIYRKARQCKDQRTDIFIYDIAVSYTHLCCAGISASLNVPPAVRGSGRSPCTRITADM